MFRLYMGPLSAPCGVAYGSADPSKRSRAGRLGVLYARHRFSPLVPRPATRGRRLLLFRVSRQDHVRHRGCLEHLSDICVYADCSEGELSVEPIRQPKADGKACTILVVEDDSILRITTADHLRAVGYSVIEAVSAEEAVHVLSSGTRVDLVFSDVSLPGMGGFSLAVWMRNHVRSIPVILTSGVESAVRPLDRQDLVPFLAKPYRFEDAEQLIAKVLERSHDTRR
jgi:CheY-like chemotaxis protein